MPNYLLHSLCDSQVQLARSLQCSIFEKDGELLSCLRRRPLEQLIGAGQSVGSAILSHPFAPAVDGTMVRPEISEFTSLLGGESEVLKEILGRYDVLGGLSAGAVLPDLGKAFWQKVDLDTFATAAIKLALKLETGSEPTESLKEVSMGYQLMIVG